MSSRRERGRCLVCGMDRNDHTSCDARGEATLKGSVMDWQALSDAAWRWNNLGDNAAIELCRFIPERPNDPADAEWLEKERGWECFIDDSASMYCPQCSGMSFGGGELMVGSSSYPNPSRMTVALFEAAAREAMKHGE